MSALLAYESVFKDLPNVQLYLEFFLLADRKGLFSDDGVVTLRDLREALSTVDYSSQYVAILKHLRRTLDFIAPSQSVKLFDFVLLTSQVTEVPRTSPPPRNYAFEEVLSSKYISLGSPRNTNSLQNVTSEPPAWRNFLEAVYHYDPNRAIADLEAFVGQCYLVEELNLVPLNQLLPTPPTDVPKPPGLSAEDYQRYVKIFNDYKDGDKLYPNGLVGYEATYMFGESEAPTLKKLKLPADLSSYLNQLAEILKPLPPTKIPEHTPPRLPVLKPAGLTQEQFEFFLKVFAELDRDSDGVISTADWQSLQSQDSALLQMLKTAPEKLNLSQFLDLAVQYEKPLQPVARPKTIFTDIFYQSLKESYKT